MIRFSCPSCSKSLKVDAKYAGRKVACPKCDEKLRVPAAPESKSDVAEPPADERPPEQTPDPPTPNQPAPNQPAPEPPEPAGRSNLDDLFDEEFGDDAPAPAESAPEVSAPAATAPGSTAADSSAEQGDPVPDPPDELAGSAFPATERRRVVDPDEEFAPRSKERLRPAFHPGLTEEEYNAWEKYIEDERRARQKPPEDELDMTPMVDVTFLLLIFFMVTVSFQLQQSMRAEAPESEQEAAASASPEEEPEEEPIIVEVTGKNEVYVDDRKVPLPEVGTAIADLKAAEPRLELKLEIDRDALHGTVVQVMDAAAAAGVQTVKRSSVGG